MRDTFRTHGKPDIAQGQMAYMRHQFDFFGLKMPAWTALTKEISAQNSLPEGEDLTTLVRQCIEDEHLEIEYFGLQILEKPLKKLPAESYPIFRRTDTNTPVVGYGGLGKLTGGPSF